MVEVVVDEDVVVRSVRGVGTCLAAQLDERAMPPGGVKAREPTNCAPTRIPLTLSFSCQALYTLRSRARSRTPCRCTFGQGPEQSGSHQSFRTPEALIQP